MFLDIDCVKEKYRESELEQQREKNLISLIRIPVEYRLALLGG
jgi:hypothetical protein